MVSDVATVSIRAGHLEGVASWAPDLQSYTVDLAVFETGRTYPPPSVRHGSRHAEFVTVDALANHLVAVGLGCDAESLDSLHALARMTHDRWGHSEILGFVTSDGGGRLFLRSPDRTVVELSPSIGHRDHGFRWGRADGSAQGVAEAVAQQAFGQAEHDELHTFALTLRVEFFDEQAGDFSLNTSSLCDWFLADSTLVTTIGETERAMIRRGLSADLGPPASRALATTRS